MYRGVLCRHRFWTLYITQKYAWGQKLNNFALKENRKHKWIPRQLQEHADYKFQEDRKRKPVCYSNNNEQVHCYVYWLSVSKPVMQSSGLRWLFEIKLKKNFLYHVSRNGMLYSICAWLTTNGQNHWQHVTIRFNYCLRNCSAIDEKSRSPFPASMASAYTCLEAFDIGTCRIN